MAFPSDPYPGQLHSEGGATYWYCPDPESYGMRDLVGGVWMVGYNHWREVERDDDQ